MRKVNVQGNSRGGFCLSRTKLARPAQLSFRGFPRLRTQFACAKKKKRNSGDGVSDSFDGRDQRACRRRVVLARRLFRAYAYCGNARDACNRRSRSERARYASACDRVFSHHRRAGTTCRWIARHPSPSRLQLFFSLFLSLSLPPSPTPPPSRSDVRFDRFHGWSARTLCPAEQNQLYCR